MSLPLSLEGAMPWKIAGGKVLNAVVCTSFAPVCPERSAENEDCRICARRPLVKVKVLRAKIAKFFICY